MSWRVSNPLACTSSGSVPLSSGSAAADLPCCIRIEPAFVFHREVMSWRWVTDFGELLGSGTMEISRRTIACFLPVPSGATMPLSLEVSGDYGTIFEARIVPILSKATRIASAALLSRLETEYMRDRYVVQHKQFEDMLYAAQEALAASRAKVIFVTGSVGKTTTKELVGSVLSGQVRTCVSTDSWNFPHEICSQIVLNSEWAEVFIIEVGLGSYMATMGKLLQPSMLVFTHLGEAHTSFGRSIEEIGETKLSLAANMTDGDMLLYNASSPQLVELIRRAGLRVESRGLQGEGVHTTSAGVQLPRFSVEAAREVARRFGLACGLVEAEIGRFLGVPHRMNETEIAGGKLLLDDCYNSNPISMKLFLERLRALREGRGGRVVAIVGDMLDLGSVSREAHQKILELTLDAVDTAFFVGSEFGGLGFTRGDSFFHTDVGALLADSSFEPIVQSACVIGVKGSHDTKLMGVVEEIRRIAALLRPDNEVPVSRWT